MWVAILSTPFLIRYFRSRQMGQHIREDGPATHSAKAGTPTMGGIAIVGAVVLGYAVGHIGTEVRFSRTGYLAVGAVVAFGLIGFLDDYIKVHHRRSLGLNKRAKSAAQLVCAPGLRGAGGALGPYLDRAVVHPRRRRSASTSGRSAGWSSPSSSWWARPTR